MKLVIFNVSKTFLKFVDIKRKAISSLMFTARVKFN